MKSELNEAAEKYADKYAVYEKDRPDMIRLFIDFVESSFAKEYWYAQWQAEQKQVPTDEEIEKLAEKEYPLMTEEEFYSSERDLDYMYNDHHSSIVLDRVTFIKGFKSALQYTKPVWVEDILEQVQRKINAISEIHGKPEKASVIGNSIVLFFKDKSVYKQSFISKETIKAVLDESALQYSVGDGKDIAIEFAKWKDDNGWKLDYQEQSTHSYEEHFYHFIHNVYKPPINK